MASAAYYLCARVAVLVRFLAVRLDRQLRHEMMPVSGLWQTSGVGSGEVLPKCPLKVRACMILVSVPSHTRRKMLSVPEAQL